jgi:hypothetical protein
MAKADSVHSTPPTNTSKIHPPEVLVNLAMAVAPKWGEAVLRLAKATERVAANLEEFPAITEAGYVLKARELAKSLIDFLDSLDDDVDLEPTLGFEFVPGSDECEIPEDAEPSLGSFDRMMDQEKSWRTADRNPDLYGWSSGSDNELDDCDHEDDDPTEESDPSGIGDQDGLDEQVPFRDWQNVGMV